MRWVSMPGRRALIYGVVVALLGGLLLGGVFVLSGIYNVAASVQHFAITNGLIRLTLRRSIEMHSMGNQPPDDLSGDALARLGARHFALGCAPCHGSPASTQNPVAAEMYPSPPPLSSAVEHWETDELFWIVKHGLKFTGMPSWPALERDEEVWSLVAFLERMPGMSADEYASLAGQGTGADSGASSFVFGADASVEDVTAFCANCHGGADSAPVHPLAPPLGGQKQSYLHRALIEYVEDRRPSGIMQPIAAEMGAEVIERVSRIYAESPGGETAGQETTDAEAVRRGGIIAARGVREDDIPACLSCHAGETSEQFPRLEGLPTRYIKAQLRLFREGVRGHSTYAQIMMPIARRLSEQQIEDVASYFASRPRPEGDDEGSEGAGQ